MIFDPRCNSPRWSRETSEFSFHSKLHDDPSRPRFTSQSGACTRPREMMHGYYLSALSLNASFRDRVEDVSGHEGFWHARGFRKHKTNCRRSAVAVFDIFFFFFFFFYAIGEEISVNVAGKAQLHKRFLDRIKSTRLVLDTIIGEIWWSANCIARRDSINLRN